MSIRKAKKIYKKMYNYKGNLSYFFRDGNVIQFYPVRRNK